MIEDWKPVENFPTYEVSNLGRVKLNGKICRPYVNRDGYVMLSIQGKHYAIHRMVCEAFHGPPPFEGAMALHRDDIGIHNWADNLSWGTSGQNAHDRKINKGKPEWVNIAREMFRNGEPQVEICRRVRKSAVTINRVVHNKIYVD